MERTGIAFFRGSPRAFSAVLAIGFFWFGTGPFSSRVDFTHWIRFWRVKLERIGFIGLYGVRDGIGLATEFVSKPISVCANGMVTGDCCASKSLKRRPDRICTRLRVDLAVSFNHFAVEPAIDVGIGKGRVIMIPDGAVAVSVERVEA